MMTNPVETFSTVCPVLDEPSSKDKFQKGRGVFSAENPYGKKSSGDTRQFSK